MSDELFGANNLIDVELFYIVEKNAHGVPRITILSDEDAFTMKADEKQKDKVKCIKSKWRLPTWQGSNELLKRSTVYNFQKQESEVDWTMYRDARLKTCLVEWDIKDSAGNPVPLTETTIDNLHANIAMAMLLKYDTTVSPGKEESIKN